METAQEVLIAGGMLMLVLGVVTGNIMAMIRMNEPTVPRYLSLAHEGCYLQGAMLLGLAVAAGLSDLSSGWENAAAWMLVVGAVLLFTKDFLNWRLGVEDEFASKGIGLTLGFLMGPLHTIGIIILTVGVLGAL
ncbi:MAG: hypothetical protein R8F63_13030 [Acidimicrobiales bacterium]|nr:hypothetical protein [Acidimicrobiales bacterium]